MIAESGKTMNKLSFKVLNKKCVGALYREIFNTQVGVIINLLNKSLKKSIKKSMKIFFFEIFSSLIQMRDPFGKGNT